MGEGGGGIRKEAQAIQTHTNISNSCSMNAHLLPVRTSDLRMGRKRVAVATLEMNSVMEATITDASTAMTGAGTASKIISLVPIQSLKPDSCTHEIFVCVSGVCARVCMYACVCEQASVCV